MTDTYDAIIIGAGHNGLVTAAYLADAGMRVLVLEAQDRVGGAASTWEPFDGYKFDTGADDAAMFSPRILGELGLTEGQLVYLESQSALFVPEVDGLGLTLWQDLGRSQQFLEKRSPGDARRFPVYLDQLQKFVHVVAQVLDRPAPELSETKPSNWWPWLRLGWKIRRSGKQEMMDLLRALPLPLRDYLDEWFEDELLKGALAVPGLTGGMPGPYAAGTTFMHLYQHLGGVGGGYRSGRFLQGGMGQLSDALAAVSVARGAEIRTGSQVERILLDNERVRGVSLYDGTAFAAQVIVSTLDARRTFFDLVGARYLMPHFMREVRVIRYNGTTARLDMALSELPQFAGAIEESQLSGYIVHSPSLDYCERAADAAKYGLISEQPILEIRIPSLLDSSRAPTGRHAMSVTVQYAPFRLSGRNWDTEKESLADRIITLLANVAPDLPRLILDRKLTTPVDYEAKFGMSEGHIFHGQMMLDQLLFMRPVSGYAHYKTPYENLYLSGAGTHPGGGVTGIPGYLAARTILLNQS
jgi:phytoene dehydrogenase-like protein